MTLLLAVLSVCLGLAYSGVVEWVLHKLLHGVGRNKASLWSFHWHDHHRAARKGGMFDAQYVQPLFIWGSPQLKEAASVLAIALLHAPLFVFFPVFTATVWFGAARYYFVHRRAHMDPEWCKRHLPWHYDHHMGRDQDANWCATSEWFDILMGTRKVYSYSDAGLPVAELQVSWVDSLRRVLGLRSSRTS